MAPRVADSGKSDWLGELKLVGREYECLVPWYVWRVAIDTGDATRSAEVGIGMNQFNSDCGFAARRLEPLRQWLPCLRPYEVSQLSVVVFFLGLLIAIRLRTPAFLSAPLLCLIPMLRICPELPLLRPGTGISKGVSVLLRCLVALWIVLLVISRLRRAPGDVSSWSRWSQGAHISASPPVKQRSPSSAQRSDPWKLPEHDLHASDYEVDEAWIPAHISPCFLGESRYEPLNMPGQGRTRVRNPEECQARCARTPGCAYFSMMTTHNGLKGCHLQEYRARLIRAPSGSVAGPADCDQEALLASALGVGSPAPKAPAAAQQKPTSPQVRAPEPALTRQQAPAPPPPEALQRSRPAVFDAPSPASPRPQTPDLCSDASLSVLVLGLTATTAVYLNTAR